MNEETRNPDRTSHSWRRYVSSVKVWLGHIELPILILAVLILGGTWAFVAIAEEVTEGDTHNIDRTVLLALRNPNDLSDPLGPQWIEEMGRDFTGLGGVGVLSFITLATIGYLLLQRQKNAALLIAVAVGGGLLLSTVLKESFDRPRPDLVPHESYVYTASFPSGHSMLSAITYLTLGVLLARIHSRRRTKIYFLSLASILTLAIGVSRVYLGVHWPSDVLAGWTIGAVWALLFWFITLWLQQRGAVEEGMDRPHEGVRKISVYHPHYEGSE